MNYYKWQKTQHFKSLYENTTASKTVEEIEHSCIAVKSVDCYNYYGKVSESTKAEYVPILRPGDCMPKYAHNRNAYICSLKNRL